MKKFLLLMLAGLASTPAFACSDLQAFVVKYKITPLGLHSDVPQTVPLEKAETAYVKVAVPPSLKVFDGYSHAVFVNPVTNKAWIRETGGFVYRTTWYGPVDVREFKLTNCKTEVAVNK